MFIQEIKILYQKLKSGSASKLSDSKFKFIQGINNDILSLHKDKPDHWKSGVSGMFDVPDSNDDSCDIWIEFLRNVLAHETLDTHQKESSEIYAKNIIPNKFGANVPSTIINNWKRLIDEIING